MIEPSITPRLFAASISVPEHRELRNAIDAANVEGTTTWVLNTAGVAVAKIAPLTAADRGALAGHAIRAAMR